MGRCRLITEEKSKVKGRSERNIVGPHSLFLLLSVCLPHNLSLFYILLILLFRLPPDKIL